MARFAAQVAAEDPAAAAEWAGTISDPSARANALMQVAAEWRKTDPEAVLAWLPGSGLTAHQQGLVQGGAEVDLYALSGVNAWFSSAFAHADAATARRLSFDLTGLPSPAAGDLNYALTPDGSIVIGAPSNPGQPGAVPVRIWDTGTGQPVTAPDSEQLSRGSELSRVQLYRPAF